jgi:hypothetical protein
MKKAMVLVPVFALLFLAMPAFAATTAKDQCLLWSTGCPDQVDDLHQRIDRLQREMAKGGEVYTRQELARLEAKLQETESLLADLVKRGH